MTVLLDVSIVGRINTYFKLFWQEYPINHRHKGIARRVAQNSKLSYHELRDIDPLQTCLQSSWISRGTVQ